MRRGTRRYHDLQRGVPSAELEAADLRRTRENAVNPSVNKDRVPSRSLTIQPAQTSSSSGCVEVA